MPRLPPLAVRLRVRAQLAADTPHYQSATGAEQDELERPRFRQEGYDWPPPLPPTPPIVLALRAAAESARERLPSPQRPEGSSEWIG
jgi:hypothetical protein